MYNITYSAIQKQKKKKRRGKEESTKQGGGGKNNNARRGEGGGGVWYGVAPNVDEGSWSIESVNWCPACMSAAVSKGKGGKRKTKKTLRPSSALHTGSKGV